MPRLPFLLSILPKENDFFVDFFCVIFFGPLLIRKGYGAFFIAPLNALPNRESLIPEII